MGDTMGRSHCELFLQYCNRSEAASSYTLDSYKLSHDIFCGITDYSPKKKNNETFTFYVICTTLSSSFPAELQKSNLSLSLISVHEEKSGKVLRKFGPV